MAGTPSRGRARRECAVSARSRGRSVEEQIDRSEERRRGVGFLLPTSGKPRPRTPPGALRGCRQIWPEESAAEPYYGRTISPWRGCRTTLGRPGRCRPRAPRRAPDDGVRGCAAARSHGAARGVAPRLVPRGSPRQQRRERFGGGGAAAPPPSDTRRAAGAVQMRAAPFTRPSFTSGVHHRKTDAARAPASGRCTRMGGSPANSVSRAPCRG